MRGGFFQQTKEEDWPNTCEASRNSVTPGRGERLFALRPGVSQTRPPATICQAFGLTALSQGESYEEDSQLLAVRTASSRRSHSTVNHFAAVPIAPSPCGRGQGEGKE